MINKAMLDLSAGIMSNTKGDYVYFAYEVIDSAVAITSYSGSAKDVEIPAQIGGKPVTTIRDWAFAYNELTGVTIPDSVAVIGDFAFAWNQLAGVTIPDSVVSIGSMAFANNQLTSVTIPDSVTAIGDFVFMNNKLTSVTIPANVDSMNDHFGFLLFFGNLVEVYIQGGSQAGTYTSGDGGRAWTKQ